MNRPTRATATALALLGALSLTACTGGGLSDKGAPKTPPPPTRRPAPTSRRSTASGWRGPSARRTGTSARA
ncbi:hypothetical protein GTX14_14410 [Streptomyces sp. SID4944]|nr:hypothetical protein [Streptomyces sp. SID4944]